MNTEQPIDRVAYSPKEAAAATGICKRTIDELMHSGQLPFVRLGTRKIVIRKIALDDFLRSLETQKKPLPRREEASCQS